MGGVDPVKDGIDASASASVPSLTEMPVASVDDSHLTAAAEEMFSDPPLEPMQPTNSSSGSTSNPRWSAVDAARGTLRASFSSLTNVLGVKGLSESTGGSGDTSGSKVEVVHPTDLTVSMDETSAPTNSAEGMNLLGSEALFTLPTSTVSSTQGAPSAQEEQEAISTHGSSSVSEIVSAAPVAWCINESGQVICPHCAATLELAAVEEHRNTCAKMESGSGTSSSFLPSASSFPNIELPAVPNFVAHHTPRADASSTSTSKNVAPSRPTESLCDDDDDDSPWVCAQCTLSGNPSIVLACQACGSERPHRSSKHEALGNVVNLAESSTDNAGVFNATSPSEGDHHGSSERALEGFVCPCCLASFPEPDALVAHFNAEHAAEFDQRDADARRRCSNEEDDEDEDSGSEAPPPGPFWRKPTSNSTNTKNAAAPASSSATAKISDNAMPDPVCFCGVSIPSKPASRWPVAILGPKPLTWYSRPAVAPPTCAHCYQPLCAAHAQEHTWPNNDACRPAFVTTAATAAVVALPTTTTTTTAAASSTTTPTAAKSGTSSSSTSKAKTKMNWVCEPCVALLAVAARQERQGWWRTRVEAAVNGEWVDRKTYVWYHARRVVEDSALAKAGRVAEMTYEAARYVPVVSTAMAAVLGVAKLSRQFGAYGIAGFLHRADIAKAVTEMRLLVGEEHLQGLSAADCAAGLYYMTSFRRAHRHTNLLAEEQLHRRNFQILQEDARLAFLYEVASLCHHSYQSDPYELERLAFSCHGLWTLAHRDGCHAGLHVEDDEDSEYENIRRNKEANGESVGNSIGQDKRQEESASILVQSTAETTVDMVNTCGVEFADEAKEPTHEGKAAALSAEQPTTRGYDIPAGVAPNPSEGVAFSAKAASDAATTAATTAETAAAKDRTTKRSVKAPLPTFVVLARDQPQKIAFVVVRGTQSLSDCLIDAQAMPRPLYLPKRPKPCGFDTDDENIRRDSDIGGVSNPVRYWVHGGMARAAAWIEAEIGPLLLQLAAHQYRIVVCGHSLGGGVAALLHARLTSKHASLAHVECVGMGTPPMVDPVLGQRTRQASFHAPRNRNETDCWSSSNDGSGSGSGTGRGVDESESAKVTGPDDKINSAWFGNIYAGTVTAVVNRDDLVCRASAANARLLVRDLQGGDAHWQGSFAADKQAFAERASTFWAPRQRGGRKESNAGPRQASSSSSSLSSSWSARRTEAEKQEMAATTDDTPQVAAAVSDNGDIDTDAGEKESSGTSTGKDPVAAREDEEEAARVAQEVPGRIVHLYKRCGATIAAAHCPGPESSKHDEDDGGSASNGVWAFPSFLRRIDPQVGMGDDHSILNYLHAIRAARVGLSAGCADEAQRSLNSTSGQEESMWTPFGSSLTCCQVCELDFTWASTSSSAAQRLMDMHHCRSCGGVVCDGCSKRRLPLPQKGMPFPERVCDPCFFSPPPSLA